MTTDETETFLILKYGSIADAYTHWLHTPFNLPHGLSDDEYNLIMDWAEETHEKSGLGINDPR